MRDSTHFASIDWLRLTYFSFIPSNEDKKKIINLLQLYRYFRAKNGTKWTAQIAYQINTYLACRKDCQQLWRLPFTKITKTSVTLQQPSQRMKRPQVMQRFLDTPRWKPFDRHTQVEGCLFWLRFLTLTCTRHVNLPTGYKCQNA